jgi:hypothetical protein
MRGRLFWVSLVIISLASSSVHAEGRSVNIPPTLEIQILDPNADPLGNPAIIPKQIAPDLMEINIPPSVLVHRYYYTGNRSFQAPFIPGGPTIVVANHPKTGERVYIQAQMPPGAPRVTYTSRSIDYDFGKHGVTIDFCALLHHGPKVEYRNHTKVSTKVHNAVNTVRTGTQNFLDRSGISAAHQNVSATTKNIAITAVDRSAAACKMTTNMAGQIMRFVPGVSLLTSSPEDQAINLRNAQNTLPPVNLNETFIPTNR